jgi:hypothetical protein
VDHIYVIGGNAGVERLDSVERYDVNTNAWTFVSPLQRARDFEERIYVLLTFVSVEIYDRLKIIGQQDPTCQRQRRQQQGQMVTTSIYSQTKDHDSTRER